MLQLRLRYLVGVRTLLSAAFVNPLRPFRNWPQRVDNALSMVVHYFGVVLIEPRDGGE